jgi:hypothetical protein
MAYQVDKFNGTFLISVEDGTIDTTTDLRFVGKNYAGYGEVQNENFLHLLENFANTTAPPKVVTGQIWFDSATKKLKFYDGSKFRIASGAEASQTAPSGLTPGDFWFDTAGQQLYAFNGTEFVLIGPESAPDIGTSALIPQVVRDNAGGTHSIAKLLAGGETMLVISKDAFTLGNENPITGFSVIKKGITLVNTNGITGITSTDHYFWGTAANALKLGSFVAEDFVRLSSPALPSGAEFDDQGFFLGDQKDIKFSVENGDEPSIENQLGQTIRIKIRVSSGDRRDVAIFDRDAIFPGTNNLYTLGKSTSRWNNVYSTLFTGNLSGNVTGNITGNVTGNIIATDLSTIINATTKTVTAAFVGQLTGNVIGDVVGTANNALTLNGLPFAVAATASTIAARDNSGNLTANQFIGTANRADRLKIDNAAVDSDLNYRSAKTTATANTIAARDSSGNLVAVLFDGTATAARYADLAEKYLCDKEYTPGTVVIVGGDAEVTASISGKRAIGVVSTNPAFMMNKDLEGGTYIALKGRVPVKVIGKVCKGDNLIAADNGHAMKSVYHSSEVFAIALEDNDSIDEKIIEAIII